ncbi:hypothetical protein [Geminocystis sp. NIES-3709]|uniref:hypothetical protein n=1 Tax=Geminocystis sp. NIES-3709 TaxID=1617448 RepID=UPI0005FCCAA9|nr:hypothetical protein [Geminocystis sp. NIES-3709]BAQ63281.1 hypothetical protein GM3709_46 [Geminocystis sp. NIES-3709]
MLEVLKLFPSYLVIITFLLVILPTFIIASMRISLYQHLRDLEKKTRRLVKGDSEGIQPRFINVLQQRFAKTSQQIENVNTIALIDGIYHQETFTSFRFNIRCEEGEYITKTLPNLLLAFGLLGTFLGITTNLYSISQIINQGSGDIGDLTSKLESPLQSMGIAFITSLIALICSSILTVNNLKHNINLEKNSLLNNLEDYLDNIYKPLVEGDTRLDKAVNKMVNQQHEFLERFHEKVGKVLEGTFKQAADKIANENQKSQQLAYQVYQSLLDASGAIHSGANIFKDSIVKLENEVQNLQNIMPIFRQNIESFDKSSNLILTASRNIKESKFSENLEKITVDLAGTQSKFTEATKLLANCTLAMANHNEKATNLAQQVYEEFKASTATLATSSIEFVYSAKIIRDSKFNENLAKSTDNLATIQKLFLETIKTLNEVVKPIAINVKTLEVSTDKMVKLAQNVNQIQSNMNTINDRYLEMKNTSREVLLKVGENSVKNITNYSELFNNLKKINQQLEERLKLLENNEKLLLTILQKMFEKFDN